MNELLFPVRNENHAVLYTMTVTIGFANILKNGSLANMHLSRPDVWIALRGAASCLHYGSGVMNINIKTRSIMQCLSRIFAAHCMCCLVLMRGFVALSETSLSIVDRPVVDAYQTCMGEARRVFDALYYRTRRRCSSVLTSSPRTLASVDIVRMVTFLWPVSIRERYCWVRPVCAASSYCERLAFIRAAFKFVPNRICNSSGASLSDAADSVEIAALRCSSWCPDVVERDNAGEASERGVAGIAGAVGSPVLGDRRLGIESSLFFT
jgi:hypothetical protein